MNTQTKRLYITIGALAVLLICSILGGAGQGLRASGSPATAGNAGGDGRYRVTPAGTGTNPYVYLLDTRTGRCWVANSPGDPWREIAQPQ